METTMPATTPAPANRVHMPTNFDPTDYTWVDAFDSGDTTPGKFMGDPFEYTMDDGTVVTANNYVHAEYLWLNRLLRTSKTSRWEERGQCDHCGAHIRYVAVMRHTPTGDHIAVGEQCLGNRFSLTSKAAFDKLRKASAEARAEQRIVNSCKAFLDANPGLRDILWPVPEDWSDVTYHYGVLTDMNRKLRRYGDLSEKQVEFARKLAAEIPAKRAQAAEREAERAAAAPAPSGRAQVTGVVVSTKWYENDFGGNLKMTVKDDTGFRVWVTVPSSASVEVGDRVTFFANFTPSDDDVTFAFGKRPSKFEVLASATDEESNEQ
jgi:hypothetical protein